METILDDEQANKSQISFVSQRYIKLMLYHFVKSAGFYRLLFFSLLLVFIFEEKNLLAMLTRAPSDSLIPFFLVFLKFSGLFIFLVLISAIFPTFAGEYASLLFVGLKLQLQKDEIQWLGFGSKLRKRYKIKGSIHRLSVQKKGPYQYIYIRDEAKNNQLIAKLSLDFVCKEIIELIQDYYEIEKEERQKKEIHIPMKPTENSDSVQTSIEEEEISGYTTDFDDFDTD